MGQNRIVPVGDQDGNRRPSVGLNLGYASGNAGLQCIVSATTYFLLIFYIDFVGLDPRLAALALALPRFWDAFSDPLMGVISDRSNFASGRRRPYILWGAPLLAVTFVLLWYPFTGGGQAIKFAYLLVANLAFTTAITIVGVPYTSLGGELSTDYHGRTTVFAYSQGLGMVGAMVGFAMYNVAMAIPFCSEHLRFATAAAYFAIPTGLLFVVVYFATRGADRLKPSSSSIKFFSMLVVSLRNHSFRNLVLTLVIVNAGMVLGGQFLTFLIIHWVKLPDILMYAFVTYALCTLISFPVWRKIGTHMDKKHALAGGYGISAFVFLSSLILFEPGNAMYVYIYAALAGFCGAPGLLFPPSMIADIADESELETGARNEGMYYGSYSFIIKLSLALGSLWAGAGLWLAGYKAGAVPSESTLFYMRMFYLGAVIPHFLGAIVIFKGYPLTCERAAQIRKALLELAHGASGSNEDEQLENGENSE